ncbi:MAG: hypothetical protein JO016_02665 [Actinobacteria bacterium]|nr:hypothetical protein [Actinomycetota bacterium]
MRKFLVVVSAAATLGAGAAAFAPAVSASAATTPTATTPATTVVHYGGMVRAGSTDATPAGTATPAATAYPSCHSIKYVGNAGFISVQEKSNKLQWGITMTPLSYSVGKWSVSTYLSGKKTTSGFNRTVTIGYIPHGSLSVPSGKIFHVMAEVVGPDGTFTNVPNACRT